MDNPQQLTIYQTFHKAHLRNERCPWIQAIGVGGYTAPGVQSDAEGDNIAQLNPYYCELTAQYWAWKQAKTEVVGFCHYRRYLNFMFDATWEHHSAVGVPGNEQFLAYLSCDAQRNRLDELLGVADAVVPRRTGSNRSVQDHYLAYHPRETWEVYLAELHTKHAEFRPFIPLYRLGTAISGCNMFVMRRPLFNEYCEDLFPVIDAVFKHIGTPYDTYNNRYPGFLAERFLGLWLHVRRLRTFEVPMVQMT